MLKKERKRALELGDSPHQNGLTQQNPFVESQKTYVKEAYKSDMDDITMKSQKSRVKGNGMIFTGGLSQLRSC